MKKISNVFILLGFLTLPFGAVALNTPQPSWIPPAKVSIAFDDGLVSAATLAAPIMAEFGFSGTAFVYTQAQNEEWEGFMSWSQVQDLQNVYGWEIGTHGYSHSDLTTLSAFRLRWELLRPLTDFARHGIRVTNFASPFGAFTNAVLDAVSKLYASHRSAWNLPNVWPWDDYMLKAKSVSPTTPVADVKQWIDEAIQNRQWLILYFHALTTSTPQSENDDYHVDDFKAILGYLQSSGVPVVRLGDALHQWGQGPNLIPNGSFEQGSGSNATGWIRSGSGVRVISNSRGVYPSPLRSVSISGGTNQRSIATLGIAVDETKQYRLKGFFRVSNYASGDASVWVSEFDDLYRYIGGQWLGGFQGNAIGTRYFDYQPDPGTKKIEIFFLTHAGARMRFELDGVELRER